MVLVFPSLVPRARAATGLVCIADQAVNPSSCPASPPNLTGAVGSVVTVAVNIQGSDSVNGFDISVQVNPSVLDPLLIMYNGSVIQPPNFVATQSTNSTTGIARLGLVALGYVVTGPVTGNLFVIKYQVLSSTSGTAIAFQTGCTGTSVPNICVTVTNPNADSESVQTATFGGAIVPDFSITANPSSQNVQAGSTATSTIVLTSFGFAGTVNLSTSPPPLCPSCPTWGVSPNTVNLSSGGTGQATLSFVTTFGTPLTTFGVNVTGTSGNLSHHTAATFTVVQPPTPDFAIAANPSSQNVQSGTSATSTITLTSLNGFAGTVNLFTSPQLLCPNCPQWSINPTSVTLAAGGAATAILTFSSAVGGPPPSTWVVNVTATSGSVSHNVVVKFTIVTPDFTISANPLALQINQGASAKSTVTIMSVNGFIGTVNLGTTVFPAGPTASIPPSVMLGSGGSNSTVLTVMTTSTTSPGFYNATVTGTSGSLTHSTVVSVQVINPLAPGTVCIASAFSNSCPATPSMFQGTVGGQLTVSVNVQNSPALNGFDVQVLTDPSILKPVGDDLRGSVFPNIIVAQNTVNPTTGLVRVAEVAGLGFVTTAPTTGHFFNITYNIVGSTPGTFILFPTGCAGTSNDNTCVTVVNAGVIDPENILEANFTSTAPPDFTMSANPSSLDIQAGTTGTSIISITSINGFAGTVSLTTNTGPLIICPPACSTWSVSPTSVTLTPGGTATAILTIKVSSFGGGGSGFTVIVFGTSGSLSHSASVVFTVIPPPTFSVTANPSAVAVRQGQTGSSALNVTSLNGFNGTVTLSMSIQPLIKKGPAISLSTTTINLASGGTATVTLGIATNGATQLGTYTVTVTATSGSLVQTVTVTVTIIARR